MNNAILQAVIASVRLRVLQADCPIEPAHTVETLENAILDLAGALETELAHLSAEASWADGSDLARLIARRERLEAIVGEPSA